MIMMLMMVMMIMIRDMYLKSNSVDKNDSGNYFIVSKKYSLIFFYESYCVSCKNTNNMLLTTFLRIFIKKNYIGQFVCVVT